MQVQRDHWLHPVSEGLWYGAPLQRGWQYSARELGVELEPFRKMQISYCKVSEDESANEKESCCSMDFRGGRWSCRIEKALQTTMRFSSCHDISSQTTMSILNRSEASTQASTREQSTLLSRKSLSQTPVPPGPTSACDSLDGTREAAS